MKSPAESGCSAPHSQQEPCCNPRGHAPLSLHCGRRDFLRGGIGLGLLGFFGGTAFSRVAAAENAAVALKNNAAISLAARPGFTAIPPRLDPQFDSIDIAPGYRARPFFSWGDPVLPGAPAWLPDASQNWQIQLQQAGDNHDGMHYFPFDDAPNDHGLLVINHEYVNSTLHENGRTQQDGKRPPDEVKKEQAAHGVSVIEVRRNARGEWQQVASSRFNRRITAFTPMQISGPLAGHPLMQTASDPDGRTVLGTLGNCAMGFTPWGTYLACEENWNIYFHNRDAVDQAKRLSHWRYGIPAGQGGSSYQWETADPRFDATPRNDQTHGGHVHEPHRFGWVVEIDPFDPHSTPVKRTALGRLFRECATVMVSESGQLAIYSGDDAKGEYIYKFVPAEKFDPAQPLRNRNLLDSGTLYVARFLPQGQGEWKALVLGENGLTPQNGFASQADILLNTRAAADQVQATPMDRPEWVAVHPRTREVYVSCTNNDARGSAHPVDAANPRARNLHGHIVRWNEADADPAATTFRWDLFLLAGEAENGNSGTNTGTIQGDLFSSPDGLAFDADGRLWIATDYDDAAPHNRNMGCNQLLCADPVSREVKRFLAGPRGCEITGITWTPDHRTLWINVQHPGLHFPASDGKTRPRSTTLVITKNDGGVIGT